MDKKITLSSGIQIKIFNHKRIAFIENSVFPYRTTFYEKLNSHQEYDMSGYFFIHKEKRI